jgi:hypothetical protein
VSPAFLLLIVSAPIFIVCATRQRRYLAAAIKKTGVWDAWFFTSKQNGVM